MQVLIADDQPERRAETAHAVRRSLGARTVEVSDGGEALAVLEASGYAFDLVIVEADLPRASGLLVLSAVTSARPEVPVVVCGSASDQTPARERGAEAFVLRPVHRRALASAVVAASPADGATPAFARPRALAGQGA
jgi:CheY-like chemotaxis protein